MRYPFSVDKIKKHRPHWDEQSLAEGFNLRGEAKLTTGFGLVPGYIGGRPGFHPAVDHSAPYSHPDNFVKTTFPYYASRFEHPVRGYGSWLKLFHSSSFMVGVAHMDPDQVSVIDIAKEGDPIGNGVSLGRQGDLGLSYGTHSHIIVQSWGISAWKETCLDLDKILEDNYGDRWRLPISESEVALVYRSSPATRNYSTHQAKGYFTEMCRKYKIVFINNFIAVRRTDHRGRLDTYYNPIKIAEVYRG